MRLLPVSRGFDAFPKKFEPPKGELLTSVEPDLGGWIALRGSELPRPLA